MVSSRERRKAEDCMQLDKVLSPRLSAVAVFGPTLDRDLQLSSDQVQQRRKRKLIDAEHDTGIAEIGELHGKAKPVRGATTLPNDSEVGLAQGVAPD